MKMMKTAALTLAGVLLASLLSAQTPRGAEIKVNNLQASSYWVPQVAAAPNGDFVVVWQTGGPQVGTPTVWVRLFRADGTPKAQQFRVSPSSTFQEFPRLAVGADGSFVVVWEEILSTGGTITGSTVSGRRFGADGRPRGRRFRLNSNPAEDPESPSVAVAPDGSFVVAWSGTGRNYGHDIDDITDIYARRFDAAGQPLGPDFLVNSTTADEQDTPQVAMSASGDFVIAWASYGGEAAFFDIYARRFARDGVPQGDDFQVNSGDNADISQYEFALGMAKNGSFAVLWNDAPDLLTPYPNGFFGQRFAAGGQPLGQPFQINASQGTVQREPAIALGADGSFFAAWSSYVPVTGPQPGPVSIVGRRFASDGTPRGRDFRLDQSGTGGKGSPSVALGGDGRGLVVWAQANGIFALRLVP
jgi:hypothetical protein